MRKILITIFIFLTINNITAQEEITDLPTEGTRQHKITIGNSLLFENTSLDGKLFTSGNIDNYKKTISNGLLESNVLAIQNKFEFSYSRKPFKNQLGFSIGFYDRIEMDLSFSKDLFDLVFFGNEQFMGQQINLHNTTFSATKFQQINIGVSRIFKLNTANLLPNKMEVGLGYSYLIGNHHLDFSTNDSYIEIGENGEYINTNLNFTGNIADTNDINLLTKQGGGYSLDFLLNLKKDDNNIHFSITDLGSINWEGDGATNYSTNQEISFSGVEIENLLNVNDSLIEIQLDSLDDIDFVKKENEFKTYLATTYHIAYKRDLSLIKHIDYITIGWIGKYRKGLIPSNFKPKYYIGTNLNVKGLNLRTSYSLGGYSKSAWQMEVSQNILWQHFRLVLGTHHFMSIFKGIEGSNIDFYLSLNFLFGKKI